MGHSPQIEVFALASSSQWIDISSRKRRGWDGGKLSANPLSTKIQDMGCIESPKYYISSYIFIKTIDRIKAWRKSQDERVWIPATLRIIVTQRPFSTNITLKRYSAAARRIKVRNLTIYYGYDGWWWWSMVKISRDVKQYFNIEQHIW